MNEPPTNITIFLHYSQKGSGQTSVKQCGCFLLVNNRQINYNGKSAMGLIVLLVHAEVFKTFWEARAVFAGFDSQAVPPSFTYQGIRAFPLIKYKPRFNPSSQTGCRKGTFPIRYRLRHQILQ